MDSNYRHRLQRDLARKIERDASRPTRSVEIDERALDRAGAQSIAAFTVDDLAEVIVDAIRISERRMVEHMKRVTTLIETKNYTQHEKARVDAIHRRLTEVESLLRRMARKT